MLKIDKNGFNVTRFNYLLVERIELPKREILKS